MAKIEEMSFPSFGELLALNWRTSGGYMSALVNARSLNDPELDGDGTLRNQRYRALFAGNGTWPESESVAAAGKKVQKLLEDITKLSAYRWLSIHDEFQRAKRAFNRRSAKLSYSVLNEFQFLNVIARSLAIFAIESDSATAYPNFEKRAVHKALQHSSKLVQLLVGNPSWGFKQELLSLLNLEFFLRGAGMERGKHHDDFYARRKFVATLAIGFKHYFGSPLATDVHRLAKLVDYKIALVAVRAQIRDILK